METATFTITKGEKGVNIKSRRFNRYNKCEIPEKDLYNALAELTDLFNNTLEIGIVFEVES